MSTESRAKIGQVTSINSKEEKETLSFRYLNSFIIVTHSSPDRTETDTMYTSGDLITRDKLYKYIYENKRLVEMQPLERLMSHYTIYYDNTANAVEVKRTIPPLSEGDETVIQITTYEYDATLKNRFLFSTDWSVQPSLLTATDVYELPTSRLFGLGSANLVKTISYDGEPTQYQYKYLSFNESGYPTHYAIYEITSDPHESRLVTDYTITYKGNSLAMPQKKVRRK